MKLRAIFFLLAASALFAARTTDSELTSAQAATTVQPSVARNWNRLGDAFMQKGRETSDFSYCQRAEKAYRKALEIAPDDPEALAGMAWSTGVRHDFEASIEWARKVLKQSPTDARAHGLIGDAALELGDYDLAFSEYQAMLDSRPDLASYSRSAHLLALTGDLRRGMTLMAKALQSGSPYGENTAWCRAQLALMQFGTGAYLAAAQTLEEGLATQPANAHLLAAMGRVKAAMRQYDAAIGFYQKAVSVAPQLESVAALGDLYQLTGKPAESAKQYALVESIAALQKAQGVKGDASLARFYADHNRNSAEAVRLAEEEFRTRKNILAADALAWSCYRAGRLEDARKHSEFALKLHTPDATLHYHRGMILAALGDRAGAMKALYAALSISPAFDPLQAQVAREKIQELGTSAAKKGE